MTLDELLAGEGLSVTGGREDIRGLTLDSRKVEPGFVFAALPGVKVHGRDFIPKALAAGAAMELAEVRLGGNRTSPSAPALTQGLRQVRNELSVVWRNELNDAKSIASVGTVYPNSPAARAGLRTGDSLVAFGAVQHATFESVTASVVPVVKARVGKEIDCVVVRLDEASKVHQIALTLVPQKWEGSGLLGCILK